MEKAYFHLHALLLLLLRPTPKLSRPHGVAKPRNAGRLQRLVVRKAYTRAAMPERILLRRTKGWRMPEGAVKVDRSTKWGNHIAYICGKRSNGGVLFARIIGD